QIITSLGVKKMKTEIKNGNLIITVPVDERESGSGKTILVASETARGETYKGKDILTVQVNAYFKNVAYVKPTVAEKAATTKAQIAELQSTLA
ncbi:MAG: hypothetical protein QQN41_06490, partial [Nitrosopumilus sp.]